MNIKIIDKNGVTLKTKGKYCKEDISVAVDESITGITPTGTYQVTNNGEYDITEYAKVNVNVAGSGGGENTLKKLLDYTKSAAFMFYGNKTITDLTGYISYNDTENINNVSSAFCNCTSLKTIPLLNTSNVTTMANMCRNCSLLEKVDISYFFLKDTTYSSGWFENCYSLKTLIIRGVGSKYQLNSNAFTNCYHLTGTVNATYNPNGDKDGYIYVPRSMVDTLKSKTNWATYADQIRALEDYTVDGTTTGELDESKI